MSALIPQSVSAAEKSKKTKRDDCIDLLVKDARKALMDRKCMRISTIDVLPDGMRIFTILNNWKIHAKGGDIYQLEAFNGKKWEPFTHNKKRRVGDLFLHSRLPGIIIFPFKVSTNGLWNDCLYRLCRHVVECAFLSGKDAYLAGTSAQTTRGISDYANGLVEDATYNLRRSFSNSYAFPSEKSILAGFGELVPELWRHAIDREMFGVAMKLSTKVDLDSYLDVYLRKQDILSLKKNHRAMLPLLSKIPTEKWGPHTLGKGFVCNFFGINPSHYEDIARLPESAFRGIRRVDKSDFGLLSREIGMLHTNGLMRAKIPAKAWRLWFSRLAHDWDFRDPRGVNWGWVDEDVYAANAKAWFSACGYLHKKRGYKEVEKWLMIYERACQSANELLFKLSFESTDDHLQSLLSIWLQNVGACPIYRKFSSVDNGIFSRKLVNFLGYIELLLKYWLGLSSNRTDFFENCKIKIADDTIFAVLLVITGYGIDYLEMLDTDEQRMIVLQEVMNA